MTRYQKWIVKGAVIIAVSVLTGIIGAVWGVYSSFDAMKVNENAGIGRVGAGLLLLALVATIAGIIGSLVGIVLVVLGIVKGRKST